MRDCFGFGRVWYRGLYVIQHHLARWMMDLPTWLLYIVGALLAAAAWLVGVKDGEE